MEIRETDTFVIMENAPFGFCKCVELLPLRLFWYEIIMSEGIMRVTVVPSSIEPIKYFDIDEILDKEKMIDDDEVEVKLNLYFVKG